MIEHKSVNALGQCVGTGIWLVKDTNKSSEVTEMFSILIVNVYTFVKTHWTAYLKCVHFIYVSFTSVKLI